MFQEHQNARIQGCLSWLHQRAMCGPNRFKVRFLEDLSQELFARQSKNVSESSIRNMLTTTAFDYEPNTRYTADIGLPCLDRPGFKKTRFLKKSPTQRVFGVLLVFWTSRKK